MRIFVENYDGSPHRTVQHALDVLRKAGIHSVEGGGTIDDRALILINPVHAAEAIETLSKAGMRTDIG